MRKILNKNTKDLINKMETPISAIIPDETIQVQTDGSAGFAVMPDVQNQQIPVQVPLPTGPSQGNSSVGLSKEFFNIQSDDLLSVVLVFGLLLLVSSGLLNSVLSGLPMLVSNDKLTPVGSIVVSALFAIIYFFIKVLGRKLF